MATYGSRDRNPFRVPKTYDLNGKPVPSNNGNTGYYTLVDSGTGEITVKSPTVGGAAVGASGDRTVGTIPKDGVFKPEPGSATTNEVQYFTSAQGQKDVKNHAVITAQKAGLDPQKAKQLVFPNTATPGGVPGTTPGTTPGATPAAPGGDVKPKSSAEDLATISGRSTGRKKFPNLRYPLNLDSSPQDKIKIEMLEYKPSTFAKETLGFQRPNVNRTPIGSVYLPIPAGISDTNNCNWGSDGEMNAAQIAAGDLAMGGITGGKEGFTSAAERILTNAFKGSGVDLKTAASTLMAGDAAGVGGGLLKRVTGGVLNPNLELLFGGPGLRTFNFTFKMSARSEEEAKQIIGIIRFFKQGMAPQKSTTNLFVKAPHTFRLTYIHKNQTDPHRFLNRFKECALTSLTTNYTPEGQYATFYDGPMVSYEMQMQFAELDPVFNEDYTDKKGSFLGTGDSGPDTEIGF